MVMNEPVEAAAGMYPTGNNARSIIAMSAR